MCVNLRMDPDLELFNDFEDKITDEENDAILEIFDNSNISIDYENFIMTLLNSTFRYPLDTENEIERELLNALGIVCDTFGITYVGITALLGTLRQPKNIQAIHQEIFNYLNTIIENIFKTTSVEQPPN